MNKANDVEMTTWRSRLKKTVAGLVLAGALFGGVSFAAAEGPSAEDTTEEAWGASSSFSWTSVSSWGISWR